MKQAAVVKKIRIVQMPITKCLNAMPSDTNRSSNTFVSIDEQMRARGEKTDLFSEKELDMIIKDYDQAWKILANS